MSHVTLWNSGGWAVGSGENSVFHFGYNFYLLKYLRDTNQLSSKLNTKAIDALNKGNNYNMLLFFFHL